MGRKSYLGGSQVVSQSGKWPRNFETINQTKSRFSKDDIQAAPRNEARSENRVIRKRRRRPESDEFLSLVVWAIVKGVQVPAVPSYMSSDFSASVLRSGGPIDWAATHPRFDIVKAAIGRRFQKYLEEKGINSARQQSRM